MMLAGRGNFVRVDAVDADLLKYFDVVPPDCYRQFARPLGAAHRSTWQGVAPSHGFTGRRITQMSDPRVVRLRLAQYQVPHRVRVKDGFSRSQDEERS